MGGGRGGRKRGRTQRRDFRQGRDNVWKKSRPEPPPGDSNPKWEPFATQNAAFDEYYKEQGIVPEDEWDEFIRVLRKPLPAAFRINSSGQFYMDIREQLENDFMKSLQAEFENDSEAEPIRPLLWYPDNLAWHVNYSRMQLRKNQTLERFHEFLKQENEVGNITRQEAVSMVPPLFLDVDPDHVVLDMCAAPGSKTFQLLEIIHQSMKSGTLPNGLVIANDVDVQRCNLLIHQTKRMSTANLIVTNHEAQHFPGCLLKEIKCREFLSTESICGPSVEKKESCEVAEEEFSKRQLLFDRVLCDVPCSGDGTLRKAPDIWRKWNAGMGNGLHRLQVQIAMRGLALLKVGGRMVYSTCSMNPIENEAVVSEVLRRSRDSVELIDVSAELPHLTRRPGLKKWKVRDKGVWLASYGQLPLHRKFGIVPSMFPAAQIGDTKDSLSGTREEALPNHTGSHEHEGNNVNKDDSENMMSDEMAVDEYMEESCFPLQRCMRIVPHDQNTGAFFIAVFHKVGSLPEIAENITSRKKYLASRKCKSPENSDMLTEEISKDGADDLPEALPDIRNKLPSVASLEANAMENYPLVEEGDKEGNTLCGFVENGIQDGQPEKQKCQSQGKWRGVDPVIFFDDDATVSSIRNFYGISNAFPFDGHLVTRNSDLHRVKRIYYVSKSVSDILRLNFQVGQQLKITSLGLKIFERQTSKEGSSGSSACAFRISSEGLPLLLPHMSRQIMPATFADFEHLLRYRTIKFADFVCPAFREKVPALMLGCCVIVLTEGNQIMFNAIEVNDSPIAVGCWKGRTNISVMLSELDCRELLERLVLRKGESKNSLLDGEEVKPEIGNEADLIQDLKSSLLDGEKVKPKAGNEAELTEINVAENTAMDIVKNEVQH